MDNADENSKRVGLPQLISREQVRELEVRFWLRYLDDFFDGDDMDNVCRLSWTKALRLPL